MTIRNLEKNLKIFTLTQKTELAFFVIRQFYHSKFWRDRYYRRLDEEGVVISKLPLILRKTDELEVQVKTYWDVKSSNGLSYGKVIELNRNLNVWENDPEHLEGLLMHEFGHIQYNLKWFLSVVKLNRVLFKNIPLPIGLENEDEKYFTDHNEIRLRIIPLVMLMWRNNWSAEKCYELVCKYDDIFSLYSKDTIIYWLDNML